MVRYPAYTLDAVLDLPMHVFWGLLGAGYEGSLVAREWEARTIRL